MGTTKATQYVSAACALLLSLPCTWLGAANTAQASPLLELIGDTGSAGGLQARTVAGGSGAAYFNPALLTDSPAGPTLGFVLLRQDINISLDGRPGPQFGIPEGIENARNGENERLAIYPAPTNLLQFGQEETASQPAILERHRAEPSPSGPCYRPIAQPTQQRR